MHQIDQNIERIKCYRHYKPITCVNLSKICPYGSRILCDQCEKNSENVQIARFKQLCYELQQKMIKAKNPLVEMIRNNFTNTLQQIYDLIELLKAKVQNALSKSTFPGGVVEGIQTILSYQIRYGLKDFETLAQNISESVESFGGVYNLIEYQVDDQKLAESNEYCDVAAKLLQVMGKFYTDANLINKQQNGQPLCEQNKQVLIEDNMNNYEKESQKLFTNMKHIIADVQLNFDQTIIGARYMEPQNAIQFWQQNKKNQWSTWTSLECHSESLINFQFSKYRNILISCGSDSKEKIAGNFNKTLSSAKIWQLNDQLIWHQKAIVHNSISRLACLTFNNSENLIVVGQGGTVVVLEQVQDEFIHQQNKQKSSEMITALAFNCYDTILAVGASDQKITLWNYLNKKLTLLQQIKLYNTPKQLIFSNVQNELYICTKDGLLHIVTKINAEETFTETQRIVNNIDKIRAIGLSKDSNILGVGGETNAVQFWRKQNNNSEWRCCQEIRQDDFVEAISFGNYERLVVVSSNTDIYVHYKYY